ncbi:hypothetical protein SAMN06298212_1075 [Ruaniaceae bacterium KH17]|nr:hypothetical protein SAMN06298212_1075 [Ruaniaceae bacterium KH17]
MRLTLDGLDARESLKRMKVSTCLNPRVFGVDLCVTPLAAKTKDPLKSLITLNSALGATIERETSTR